MSKQVYWNLELNIKEGKLSALKELIGEMVASTRENEPGTLTYEWSVNDAGTICHIYERYRDSDALMTHLGNFQKHFAGRFFSILDVTRFSVYGHPNEQVRETLGGLGAKFFGPLGGFVR